MNSIDVMAEITIDRKTSACALQEIIPELTRIDTDDLVPVRIDLLHVVSTILRIVPRAWEDRPLFERSLRDFPIECLTRLELYALALWEAELVYRQRQKEIQVMKTPPLELIEQCRALRRSLIESTRMLWGEDIAVQELLQEMQNSIGYHELAHDLHRLAHLATIHGATVDGTNTRFIADGQCAEYLSTQLLKAIETEQVKELSETADQRSRAWTLLYHCYEELRAGAAFIFRHQPEKLAIYQRIWSQYYHLSPNNVGLKLGPF